MAITTISRYALVDDVGDGETGDVINAAFFGTVVYDKVDALIAGDIVTGGTFRTGYTDDATSYTQANQNLLAGNDTEAVGVAGGTLLTNVNFYIKGVAQRKITFQIATDGADGGSLSIFTKNTGAGDVTVKGIIYNDGGFVWGGATGGNKGAGTINAKAVYDDNTLLTDWVLELAFRGTSELPHAGRLFSLEEVARIAEAECRLPWMPSSTNFESERHHGGMITRLVQGQEQQQLYLFDLARRLAMLEAA